MISVQKTRPDRITLPKHVSNIFPMIESQDGRSLTEAGSKVIAQILSPVELELIKTAEFERLKDVSQANSRLTLRAKGQSHTRYLHSLQTAAAANWLCSSLGTSEVVTRTIISIMLLHDIAHPPFNHVGEEILNSLGMKYDHDQEARRIIEKKSVTKILLENNVNPEIVASVIEESGKYPNLEFLKNILDRTYLHDDISSSIHAYGKNIDAIKVINKMLSSIHYSSKIKKENKQIKDFEEKGILHVDAKAVEDFMNLRRSSYYETTYHPASMLAKYLLTRAVNKSGISTKKFLKSTEKEIIQTLDPYYREALTEGVESYYKTINIPLSEFSEAGLELLKKDKFIKKLLKSAGLGSKIGKDRTKVKKRHFVVLVTPDYSKKIEIVVSLPGEKELKKQTIHSPVEMKNRSFVIYLSNELSTEDKKKLVKNVLFQLHLNGMIADSKKWRL